MDLQRAKKCLPGVFLKHYKNTDASETIHMPIPKMVRIPMLQHIGAECVPLVEKGDRVKLGQKIGENKQRLSSPIHASVSGTVLDIEKIPTPLGEKISTVIIESDGLQTVDESVSPPEINNKEDVINALYESGLVGLGGAGFPTHKKLNFNKNDVDTIIINSAECEPYITSDNRELLENTSDIIDGVLLLQKYLEIEKAYIGIEDNKKEALGKIAKAAENTSINVVSLPSQYPQGAEKVLIYAITGRVVEEGKIPATIGVVVLNVTTVSKLIRYIRTGMPLTAKRLTVDGDCIKKPQNVRVPIGTPIKDVIEFCDGFAKEPGKIIYGGPMMGIAVSNVEAPVIKNNNAILAFSKEIAAPPEITACIRCGKCSEVCPVRLMPRSLEIAHDTKNLDMLKEYSVNLCINCGSCSYICPAKRNLAEKHQLSKIMLKN